MEQLNIIRTISQLQDLRAYLQDKDYIAFDSETTGTDTSSDKIIGISVCAEDNVGFYVIANYWDKEKQQLVALETLEHLPAFCESLKGKSLIAHNAIFDCDIIESNFDVDLMPHVHTDTLILAHLLNENRRNGLKELGTALFGNNATKEQSEMKASITANGGVVSASKYELYKADADLIARYGAKDAILTYALFLKFVPELYEQGLDKFFYDEESMPLLRGPTYDLNTVGLKVDMNGLRILQTHLESSLIAYKEEVLKAVGPHVKDKYPGTKKTNHFNIGASQQMAWLLFGKLGCEFNTLTEGGKELCKAFDLKVPYSLVHKKAFIAFCLENEGKQYGERKKVGVPWKYMQCDEDVLIQVSKRYKWVETLLKHRKETKLLSTYVMGIQERAKYGIIRPSFLQHGTTSGRYSSRDPNFQNLPRDDKRIKECIVSRAGHVFVGADYSQLEPRVFASVSQDPTLMGCFAKGEDFYSVVGGPIFDLAHLPTVKDAPGSFAKLHPDKRNIAKAFALATPYGTSAWRQSRELGLPQQECQYIIDRYFETYPRVELMMLEQHEKAKKDGVVHNLYGRPRRIPPNIDPITGYKLHAQNIPDVYGADTPHGELPYEARNMLNLGMNHCVQSTAASIVNRAAIKLWRTLDQEQIEAKIVLQVHDQLVVECLEQDAQLVAAILQDAMETAATLPGVKLEAKPFISKNLADQK